MINLDELKRKLMNNVNIDFVEMVKQTTNKELLTKLKDLVMQDFDILQTNQIYRLNVLHLFSFFFLIDSNIKLSKNSKQSSILSDSELKKRIHKLNESTATFCSP